ncbi:MAG: hypothetical protein NC548_15800 [Lachnospiraceae bacterium]|nr:hypothetical protein [Lachnospiraceae bacterium]
MDLNQSAFTRMYNDKYREQFNHQLFERNNEDLINSISKIIYSCERDKYFTLKVLSIRPIINYEEIYNTLREHVESRRKIGDKSDNQYDFININDSDIMLLEVKYHIRHNGVEKQKIDGKMVDVVNPETILQVLIALPRFVNKYYFYLNGNFYNTTFQIVDGSTYNNSTANNSKVDSVTDKTMFQPVRVFRMFRDMVDVNTGQKDRNIIYTSIIFNNHVDLMYYIFAAFGLQHSMEFLNIYNVRVSQFPITEPGWSCYQKHNVYVAFPTGCPDPMVQSFAVTIYDAIMKDTNVNDLYNQRFWLKVLGIAFKNATPEKGLFVLDSVESIYDLITKENLQLPEEYKGDIYQILRWMAREFPSLRAKDNVDVTTKHARIADYMTQVYATKLSGGIHRISDLGKRVTLKSVIKAIYTNPMFLIKEIVGMDNLVDYVDMVNDNDATTALKFTYKGISGLGENGASVQPIYRHVDPSHIGILDLDVSSTSDPGMSGMICPMTPIYNGNFSEYSEPNNWEAQYGYIQEAYRHRNPEAQSPFTEGFQPTQFDPIAARQVIIDEALDLDKVQCPIFNLTDPNVNYTRLGCQLKEEEANKPKSLFTIRKDDE